MLLSVFLDYECSNSTCNLPEILISPIRECAAYTPKFGHGRSEGYSLADFQKLYGADTFYKWLGLDNPLMYSAHKAAGGITSIYRQIGIGSERLVREILKDNLGLNEEGVKWSYQVRATNGKMRTHSLDGRIIFDDITNAAAKERLITWKENVCSRLELPSSVKKAMSGVVFEVRQGYKSKDSKRQNADIANASNAYANGYIPCLMVMSSQIDDDIVTRYNQAKWLILEGYLNASEYTSTFNFFENIVGFNFSEFMSNNQDYFKKETHKILQDLMKAE